MSNVTRRAFIDNERRRLRCFENAVVGLNTAEGALRQLGQSVWALDLNACLVHCKKEAERARLNIAVQEREAAREAKK